MSARLKPGMLDVVSGLLVVLALALYLWRTNVSVAPISPLVAAPRSVSATSAAVDSTVNYR